MRKSFSRISFFVLTAFLIGASLSLMPQEVFAAEPQFTLFVADDPDNLDSVLSNGDTLTITFSESTNATNNGAVTQAELVANFTDNSIAADAAVDWGTTFTGVWNGDSTILTVTLTDVGGATLVVNTSTIEGRSTTNISSLAEGTNAQLLDATTVDRLLTGDFGVVIAVSTNNDGGNGSGCSDCEAPTLGVDDRGTRLVDNGFSYNGNPIDVERYFTPYPLVKVSVGKQNVAEFKIYDDKGPDSISHFELAFGLANGESIGKSKAVINWDRTFDGIETVTIDDPENVLDEIKVTTSEGYCSDESQQKCLIVTVTHTFRAPLDFNILGTNVWDSKRNTWQNYYNHGIEVVGESLNPAKEYDGINKGQIYHLIETSKTTAVDEFGNSWSFNYGSWNMDYIDNKNTPVTLFLKEIIPTDNGFAGSNQFGTMYYLTQTSEITAVDMFGNNWSLESGLWIMDSIYSQMILDGTPMAGYTRADSEFNIYKYGQSLLAENKLNEICSDCFDERYGEINNIFAYDFPLTG